MRNAIITSLRAILTCNFTALDQIIFQHRFLRMEWTANLSLSMRPFRSCLLQQKIYTNCLSPLFDQCQRSSVVAVKVIRLDMSLVEELLRADQDLRVIHLVRDPRGMMESYRRIGVPKQTNEQMRISADIACKRMLEDCIARRRLGTMYPGRTLLVRYEDLATATDRVLSDIYNWLLNLAVPESVRKGMNSQLYAHSQDGSMGTKRKNGTATAYKWKHTIDGKYLAYVNKTCRHVLHLLNYDKN